MYLHISFKDNLAGVWEPKLPNGMELKESNDVEYPEPNIPRISLAPTEEKCFDSIYPNVSSFFEEKNYPYMDFFVYTPAKKLKREDFIPTKILTQRKYIWDAHFTEEIWAIKPLEMKLVKKIRVFNPGENPDFNLVHPFKIKSNAARGLSPKNIRVMLLEVYPEFWTLRKTKLEW